MNRGSTLYWAWDLHMHEQICSLSNVLRRVFLIIIRFCDFLIYHGLLQFKPWSGNWKAFWREMPKSNSLQKAMFYVVTFVTFVPIKILSTKQQALTFLKTPYSSEIYLHCCIQQKSAQLRHLEGNYDCTVYNCLFCRSLFQAPQCILLAWHGSPSSSTLGAEMFGLSDFWLETRAVIKRV